MSKKSWKNHLLSSGLPLEHSVIQELKKHKFLNPREFRYERKNEHGVSALFSVDVHATSILSERKLWLDLLIECKYRHESTQWVFNPDEYDWGFGVEFNDSFVILDALTKPRRLDRAYLNRFSDSYPLCAKGIELVHNDRNPKSIDQAIAQLAYAVPDQAVSALNHQASLEEPYIHLIIPMIVTTSELWRLRSRVSVSDVCTAQELSDVAEKGDILVVHKKPDNELSRYTNRLLDETLDDEAKELLEEKRPHGFNHFQAVFSDHTPSAYVLIHYSRFEQAITNLLRFVRSDRLIKVENNAKLKMGTAPAD